MRRTDSSTERCTCLQLALLRPPAMSAIPPLLEHKRTSDRHRETDVIDPSETCAALDFCSAHWALSPVSLLGKRQDRKRYARRETFSLWRTLIERRRLATDLSLGQA